MTRCVWRLFCNGEHGLVPNAMTLEELIISFADVVDVKEILVNPSFICH